MSEKKMQFTINLAWILFVVLLSLDLFGVIDFKVCVGYSGYCSEAKK